MASTARARSCWVHYLQNSSEWDPHPVRPAVELVAELVQRLLEQHRRQLEVEVIGRLRHERGGACGGEVAAQESRRDGVCPEPRPCFQAGPCVGQKLVRSQGGLAGIRE